MKIFLGPTRPANIPAEADLRPPAQQGDIAAAALEGPDTLILIDGLFHQSLAPWHKEILFALDRGCRVIGAGSLGALRAVECARYGAEPVGVIAGWYAEESCTDDADVALAHACSEDGYRPLSIPLVNLRATAEAHLPPHEAVAILHRARAIYYPDRTWQRLRRDLGDVVDILQDRYIDQKALDAAAAIDHARHVMSPKSHDIPLALHTPYLQALLANDLPMAGGQRLHQLATQREAATDSALLATLAEALGICTSVQDIHAASARMWQRLGIPDPADAKQWLALHNITDAAWYAEAQREALRQSARNWFSATHCAFDTVPLTLTHQLLNPS